MFGGNQEQYRDVVPEPQGRNLFGGVSFQVSGRSPARRAGETHSECPLEFTGESETFHNGRDTRVVRSLCVPLSRSRDGGSRLSSDLVCVYTCVVSKGVFQ